MALISYFSAETLSEFLRHSNYWAAKNRNYYPVKIHEAISILYEEIGCPCNNECKCKKYQCTKHVVRKTGIVFDDFYNHFLECYVDSRKHEAVRQGSVSGRGENAVEATKEIRDNWERISAISSKKHLLCSNWYEPFNKLKPLNFKPSGDTIYQAKWFSILFFDTFTAYDYNSVKLLKRDFQNPPNFLNLMKLIREDIINHLEKTGRTLQDFRQYDNPSEFFPEEIPKNCLRPLGDIIDKLYLTL